MRNHPSLRTDLTKFADPSIDPAVFSEIERRVLADRSDRVSVKRHAEAVRATGVVVNNSSVGAVARELVRRHPQLADRIELRKTSKKVDDTFELPPEHVVLAELARRGLRITTVEVSTRNGEIKRASWQRLCEIAGHKAAKKGGAK